MDTGTAQETSASRNEDPHYARTLRHLESQNMWTEEIRRLNNHKRDTESSRSYNLNHRPSGTTQGRYNSGAYGGLLIPFQDSLKTIFSDALTVPHSVMISATAYQCHDNNGRTLFIRI